jgi:hypothetical protein
MQKPIKYLLQLGPMPDSQNVSIERVYDYELAISGIKKSITDQEAMVLLTIFGPDDFYGLSWSLVHIIETSPSWPMEHLLSHTDLREGIYTLRARMKNYKQ